MKLNFSVVLGVCSGLLAQSGLATAGEPIAAVDYNRQIRPILSENCYACHGPDERQRKAGLRLDLEEGAFRPLKSGGHAIVRGEVARSLLIERISSTDQDEVMPPPKTGKKLTAQQVDLLRRWVAEGAVWQKHWSFVPPVRPAIPLVKRKDWARNEVDSFILARLEQEGLEPSPEAAKETLLRRLSYDLTGLPPGLKELDDFLADDSPEAYERVVDRLLKSPHYGERMAVHWLDLARYADTHGYHLDSGREMWKWREWVIEAFNDNMRFDRFTLEQMAGDLLPGATRAQILATGFNRNNMINFEGGAIPEEYLTHYVMDRVITTSTAYLGLTVGCAQCHDHKYDPLTMRDFYRLYAYFNAVPENGLDGSRGNAEPLLPLPSPDQERELAQRQERIEMEERRLREQMPEVDAAQLAWEKEARSTAQLAWEILDPVQLKSQGGSTLTRLEDRSVLAGGPNPEKDVYEVLCRTDQTGLVALRLEALTHESLPDRGPGRHGNASFVLDDIKLEAVSVADPARRTSVRFSSAAADYSQKGLAVAQAIDGRPNTGWAIDAPARHKDGVAWFVTDDAFGFEGGTELQVRLEFGGAYAQHGLGRFRLAVTSDAAAARASQLLPAEVAEMLALPPEARSPEQNDRLRKHYRENVSEVYRTAQSKIAEERRAIDELRRRIPTSMVMRQMDKPRDSFILVRGQYDQRGEKVDPGTPASLPPLAPDAPSTRLGLARWLIDPNHPLVARVTVNRFWQMLMGTGLVKTLNDFGSQGEWPSHPELLDWLAREFVDSGWDVKRTLKLLVMSATYRQSSAVREMDLARDPYNRLYARGPRFRLSAEQIRDTSLAASGLLVPTLGGPSVSPYQPEGLWQELSSRKDSGNWTAQKYEQSHGPDLYRRSLYTFWKRTCPPPALATFDAPDRETCIVIRERTSTPLQALVLLNDPTHVEAARLLAQRMMTEAGSDEAARIVLAFRLATARRPETREIELLRALYHRQRTRFAAQPEEARALLAVGEFPRNQALDTLDLAAWTMVASTILNLDETVNKG